MKKAAAAVVLGITTSACAAPEPAAVMESMTRPTGVAAGPTVLADSQLDSVTAAGVLVDVNSIAVALGDFAHAQTDANTFAFSGKYLDLGVGITEGRAFACCGEDADVEVGSAVLGVGDIVHGAAYSIEHDGLPRAYGLSAGFVVALSLERQRLRLQELRGALGQLRDALGGFRQDLRAAAADPDLFDTLVRSQEELL